MTQQNLLNMLFVKNFSKTSTKLLLIELVQDHSSRFSADFRIFRKNFQNSQGGLIWKISKTRGGLNLKKLPKLAGGLIWKNFQNSRGA